MVKMQSGMEFILKIKKYILALKGTRRRYTFFFFFHNQMWNHEKWKRINSIVVWSCWEPKTVYSVCPIKAFLFVQFFMQSNTSARNAEFPAASSLKWKKKVFQ